MMMMNPEYYHRGCLSPHSLFIRLFLLQLILINHFIHTTNGNDFSSQPQQNDVVVDDAQKPGDRVADNNSFGIGGSWSQSVRNSNLSGSQQPQQLQTSQNIPTLSNNISGNYNKDTGQIEAQNQFQSSISCGHLEFYIQLSFSKPFRGLVYAYKMYHPPNAARYNHYYPVEILDSCTIRGNGASIVYLEISFFSECAEKLPLSDPRVEEQWQPSQQVVNNNNNSNNSNNDQIQNKSRISINDDEDAIKQNQTGMLQNDSQTFPFDAVNPTSNTHTFNLDGFQFRRALNDQLVLNQFNVSKDDVYQLALYIQNDPKIEQKFDSKLVVQCSPLVTKNLILEQNSQKSRKLDMESRSTTSPKEVQTRSIWPKTNLTISLYDFRSNQTNISQLIDTRMDLLRGRIPSLKLIDGSVDLGDEITLIIRARKLNDHDAKIINCHAFDETNTMRYQLINKDGCPIDPSVMTAFSVLENVGLESKIYYNTFSAFKFPGSNYLNIQCSLLVCGQLCPKTNCEQQQHQSQQQQLQQPESTSKKPPVR